MKAVMLSIQPKWCELIASGKKTVEVRRTKPKIDVPFKCYIYMTAGDAVYPVTINGALYTCSNVGGMCLIGEFVCDYVGGILPVLGGVVTNGVDIKETCLTTEQITQYLKAKRGYGWHITDLVIYDKPKDLREFKPYNRTEEDCKFSHLGFAIPKCEDCHECYVKKPPQSYLFVEELKGETE